MLCFPQYLHEHTFQYNISLEVMPKLPTEMPLKRPLKLFFNVIY